MGKDVFINCLGKAAENNGFFIAFNALIF